MGHSWRWRLVLACFLLVVVVASGEWEDNDDFAVDAATERFVEQTEHEMAMGVQPKTKLTQQTTKNSTKLSSKGSSSKAKSSNAKKKRAQKQKKKEKLDAKTLKERQVEETVQRAVKDMTPLTTTTKASSTGSAKKNKLNTKEKKQTKKKTTKESTKKKSKKRKESKKKTKKKGKEAVNTNEAELNYAYETTHTKTQYDAQIAKAKAEKRTLLKKLAAATAAQSKIPLYKQKLRQLTRKQTRATAGKRKIQLAKKLKAEEKDEAVLKKAMADSRARYAKMVDAKMALDAEKKSTASELERLVTDVKLNWGR